MSNRHFPNVLVTIGSGPILYLWTNSCPSLWGQQWSGPLSFKFIYFDPDYPNKSPYQYHAQKRKASFWLVTIRGTKKPIKVLSRWPRCLICRFFGSENTPRQKRQKRWSWQIQLADGCTDGWMCMCVRVKSNDSTHTHIEYIHTYSYTHTYIDTYS